MTPVDMLGSGVVAFHRVLVDVTGSITAALMLSQALYWRGVQLRKGEEWFYKPHDQWTEECGLSRKEQNTARKRLRSLGIFEEKRKGMPATIWYRVNVERLNELILDVPKGYNKMCPKGTTGCTERVQLDVPEGDNCTLYTETTSKTTSETTAENARAREAAADTQHEEVVTKKPTKRKPKPSGTDVDLPPYIDPDVWAAWVQHRKEIRKPLKPTTVTFQLKQLEKFYHAGHEINAVIERSIANGWTGLFEPDPGSGGGSGGLAQPGHPAAAARDGTTGVRHGTGRAQDRRRGDPGTPGTTGSERAGARGWEYADAVVTDALGDWVAEEESRAG